MRTPTKITVVAHKDRIVPIPPSILRAPTAAQVKILGADTLPKGRELHPHELAGKVTIEVTSPIAAQYLRRAINRGDLVVAEPDPPAAVDPPAAAPAPSSSPAAPASTVTTAKG